MKPEDQPLTVLCADDHTLVGDALTKIFTTAGYVVVRADDGEMAWEKMAANPDDVDVVITDHGLPRLDGLGLVSRLRSAGYGGRIIVYSDALSDEDAVRYRAFSVDALIVKGPVPDRLLAVVEAFHGEY